MAQPKGSTKKSGAARLRAVAVKKAAPKKSRTPATPTPRPRRASALTATAPSTPTRRKRTTAAPAGAAATAAPGVVLRRAVFIDVENTSSEEDLTRVLDHLQLDRRAQPTELWALGNWKSVGVRVARMLAGLGAQLMHSAPSPGVRDWSDLRIAVAAGYWLATARAGDRLDVVSDDKAFDAVGDAAAMAGVVFVRTSYRTLHAAPRPVVVEDTEPRRRRRRRGGRGRRGPGASPAEPTARRATAPAAPAPAPEPRRPAAPVSTAPITDEEHHTASHEQIREALERLTGGNERWVNLDLLANTLRNEGFMRPVGSPRLIVRLRRMRDVEVSPNGMIRLATAAPASDTAVAAPPTAPSEAPAEEDAAAVPAAAPKRRSTSRRPRRRAPAAASPTVVDSAPE
jgi:hypothetical protein